MKDLTESNGDADIKVSAHGGMDQASLDIRARKSRWADISDMDTEQDTGLTPATTAEVEKFRIYSCCVF